MKRLVRNLVALVALLAAGLAFAQTPPQNGVYTFQGQGNLTSIITSLANPALNQIPIGNGQNGYSLLTPSGDFGPSGALGNYHVVGAHFNVQTCSTSPCTVISAIVQCNASSGAITLNLPGAGGTGYWTWIQKTDSTSNACAVTPAGSDTINGAAGALSLTVQSVSLYLDDAASGNWIATSGQVPGSIVGQGTFPLTTTGNFNYWSGTNANTLNLVQLTAPTPTVTSTCSGTCATTYTYEITCLGDNSTHTAPSASETCTNAASLSGSNFCSLSWTAGAGCYNGYDVYGRVGGSLGLLATVTGTTYTDTGTASPGAAPPSTNTTGAANVGGALAVTGASTLTGGVSGNVNATGTLASGANGGTGGQISLNGATSGSAAIKVAAAAGSPAALVLPTSNGTAGYVLDTDGAGNTNWVNPAYMEVSDFDTPGLWGANESVGDAFGTIKPTVAIKVQRADIYVEINAASCGTIPIYELDYGATYLTIDGTIAPSCAVSSGILLGTHAVCTTTPVSVPAGDYVWWRLTTVGASCDAKFRLVYEYTAN